MVGILALISLACNLQELGMSVGETEGRVEKAEKWVAACDEGDALLAKAQNALDAGDVDEAAGACRGAEESYKKVDATDMSRAVKEIMEKVERKRQVGRGLSFHVSLFLSLAVLAL